METKDTRLQNYLYENRISPTPAFSARIDQVLARLPVDESIGRGDRKCRRDPSARWKRSLRWLVPVAAVLLVLLTLLSIPSVSQAVREWFYDFFSADRYLRIPTDERTPNPDYDNVIVPQAKIEQTNEVLLLSETDQLDEINAYRAENGFPAYDPAEWTWLKEIEPYITDLYYDGVYFKTVTFFPCDPLPFMSGFVDSPISELRLDVLSLTIGTVTNLDTGAVLPLYPSSHGLQPQQDYWNADGSANVENMREDGGVWLFTEYAEIDLTPGRYQVSIQHQILDDHVGEMSTLGTVAVLNQTFLLDTRDALGRMEEVTLPAVRLSGVYPFTLETRGKDFTAYIVEPLDFTGMTITPTLEMRTSGVRALLAYAYPASWDAAIAEGFKGGWYSLAYELIVDGESKGYALGGMGSNGKVSLEIPMTESERAECASMILRPTIQTMTDIVMDGETHSLANGYRIDGAYYAYEPQFTQTPLPDCDIVIPLD